MLFVLNVYTYIMCCQGFELIGVLLGVAIYNSVIVDLQMPSVVYKKLKNQNNLTLNDLRSLQPSLTDGLQKLLDYKESFEGEIETVFDLRFEVGATILMFRVRITITNFQISYEVFGVMKTVELIEGGSSLLVSASNRSQ